ncbi:TetR/AcrR family transcriptional regulator [Streptomyces sp. NBC_00365]|uniref:TetR/AcrR family transcriptional regulator n=1 Tax=Streptomyces sp. NBC_00365 TaxID=2975726 RepID=UPI002253EC4E|nr:TetR/AcrR family transcriptional regulator [Streptomyces sp. NBC_00365]MCX5097065.1 TetR/AcrR family transcriptional regulator [Streptomyces sp. NBC_00365]
MATKIRKTKSEDRILTAAADLFYAHGLRGVGIDQVIEVSGVAKSTLYAHFRTKEQLVGEYLRRTDASWMAQLSEAAQRAGDDPRDQLVGLFDALTDAFGRHGFFGCPFVSAAVEAEPDSEARAVTEQHVLRRQAWLTDLGSRAGATDPAGLAGHLGLLIDGALASGRLLQHPAVVNQAKAAAKLLVDAHTGALSPAAG